MQAKVFRHSNLLGFYLGLGINLSASFLHVLPPRERCHAPRKLFKCCAVHAKSFETSVAIKTHHELSVEPWLFTPTSKLYSLHYKPQ